MEHPLICRILSQKKKFSFFKLVASFKDFYLPKFFIHGIISAFYLLKFEQNCVKKLHYFGNICTFQVFDQYLAILHKGPISIYEDGTPPALPNVTKIIFFLKLSFLNRQCSSVPQITIGPFEYHFPSSVYSSMEDIVTTSVL